MPSLKITVVRDVPHGAITSAAVMLPIKRRLAVSNLEASMRTEVKVIELTDEELNAVAGGNQTLSPSERAKMEHVYSPASTPSGRL